MEMSRGMAVRRAVTTADMATRQAQAQMDPRGADFQAFFAPESPGRTWFEIDHVFTRHDHVCTLTRVICSGPGDPRGLLSFLDLELGLNIPTFRDVHLHLYAAGERMAGQDLMLAQV
jgi:hypothetical protein